MTRGGKLVKLKRSCSVGSFLNEPKKNQETETRAAFTDACVHLKSSPEGLFEDERHLIQHSEPQPADRLPLYRWKLWRESYAPILGGLLEDAEGDGDDERVANEHLAVVAHRAHAAVGAQLRV